MPGRRIAARVSQICRPTFCETGPEAGYAGFLGGVSIRALVVRLTGGGKHMNRLLSDGNEQIGDQIRMTHHDNNPAEGIEFSGYTIGLEEDSHQLLL
jgi:hypothetical protein